MIPGREELDTVEPLVVALVGNLSDGYRCVGPFPSMGVATNAMDFVECWLMTVEPWPAATIEHPVGGAS